MIDKKTLDRVSAYVYREFGIRIQESRHYSLEAKLDRLLQREGYASADEFMSDLERGEREARRRLARYVTTGHTYFFREHDHFEYLSRAVKESGPAEPIIWCAASSTGEEAYSIAICLLESGIQRFRIVASDLNPGVLAAFNEGLYGPDCFRAMPAGLRRRYFLKAGDGRFKPSPDLRKRISIKRLNIMDDFAFPSPFDYVFCRNMLIYFDPDSRRRAMERILANLKPGGLLFLGHTEAILDPPPGLKRAANAVYRYSGRLGARA